METNIVIPDNVLSPQEIYRQLIMTGLTPVQLTLVGSLLAHIATPVRKTRVKKELSLLPAEWKPNANHYSWARERGRAAYWVDQRAERMRAWAASKEVRKADWNQVLYTFMVKDVLAAGPVEVKRQIYA